MDMKSAGTAKDTVKFSGLINRRFGQGSALQVGSLHPCQKCPMQLSKITVRGVPNLIGTSDGELRHPEIGGPAFRAFRYAA